MKECSKSISRRLADSRFARRYFVGDGIDVGGRPDPLVLYAELFPLIRSVRTWDWEDGDAQAMAGVPDHQFDFVHSSHCLEHLVDPRAGLASWMRVLKPGGHLVITVPDEDMYEQGVFPSTFNRDHKWTFTAYKPRSWSDRSLNLTELVSELGAQADLVKIEQLDASYRFDLPRYDQTLSPVAECGIELIVRRRTAEEVADRGRWRRPQVQPNAEVRAHLNQYRDDLQTLKAGNAARPPFGNTNPV